ncbi:metal-dependent hydrolase [Acinetobacter sp. YH12239]|uniref:HD domain-containing protein n=1 Tax=Acinetobacter sp. YH12239 TaxID=2601166 RepID=UPI0015D35174|nr:metal-dependent hydrolase [Acinetobacter sp. YH12239]
MIDSYLNQLRRYWAATAQQLELSSEDSISILDRLEVHYSEPHRHYHTVQHIVECMDHLQLVLPNLKDPLSVSIALWFHDVIYEPKAHDNEQQSADMMLNIISPHMEMRRCEKIYQWILATKEHRASVDSDLNYLLDIDLAILGSNAKRFEEYQQQIHQEFSWVPSEIYTLKRNEVLNSFYQMESIYKTAYFHDTLENQAKQNLERAFVRLI